MLTKFPPPPELIALDQWLYNVCKWRDHLILNYKLSDEWIAYVWAYTHWARDEYWRRTAKFL